MMATTRGVLLPHLRAWREWHALSAKTLATRSGVGTATISRIENGGHANFETVGKLAKALRLTPEQLMRSEPGKEIRGAA